MSIGIERRLAAGLCAAALALGCRQDMHDQPKYRPFEPSEFFEDGTSARAPVAGTVPWGASQLRPDAGMLRADALLFTGRSAGATEFSPSFPFEITAALLDRGQQRYEIFCAACHDAVGGGQGMVPQRGFRRPPTFHDPRLREAPAGYLFDVVTNGYGAMPAYASQIAVRDRWLIVAYVRALQLSQHMELADVPQALRPRSEG